MDLMELMPLEYQGNKTMEKLQSVLSAETEKIQTGLNKTVDECFVSTSSSLLSRYEKMYGLVVDIFKSDEVRRGRIQAKMSGTGTCTKQMLLKSIGVFPYSDADIVEDNPNYKFKVKFNNPYRIPDQSSIDEIHKITDRLKPAHLDYDHTFAYNWWGMGDSGTWNDGGTWEDLRNYVEV